MSGHDIEKWARAYVRDLKDGQERAAFRLNARYMVERANLSGEPQSESVQAAALALYYLIQEDFEAVPLAEGPKAVLDLACGFDWADPARASGVNFENMGE